MLKQRVEILNQGNVITAEVKDFVLAVIDDMHAQYPRIQDQKAEMFITHLAMATERVAKGSPVEALDARLYAEAAASVGYEQALEFMKTIKKLCFVTFPVSEEECLVLHLCNLFA